MPRQKQYPSVPHTLSLSLCLSLSNTHRHYQMGSHSLSTTFKHSRTHSLLELSRALHCHSQQKDLWKKLFSFLVATGPDLVCPKGISQTNEMIYQSSLRVTILFAALQQKGPQEDTVFHRQ